MKTLFQKKLALILALVLCAGALAGCGMEREKPPVEDVITNTAPVPSEFPVTADYTAAERQYDHVYQTPETEYVTYMDILIHEDITDVSFGLLNWDGAALYMEKALYTAPAMAADDAFLAAVVFYGDMTTYGITFTDAAGQSRSFSFVISGMDGSLQVLEY